MSTETTVRTEELQPAAPTTERVASLKAVLDTVRRDSQRDAELYLEQSQVPHGGE